MDEIQKGVLTFHKETGLYYADKPTMLPEREMNISIRLIEEEFDEYVEAYEKDDIIGMADALGDLLYVVYGAAVRLGVDMSNIMEEIQRSNMTKTGGHLDERGKFIKPETYSPPRIRQVLEWQGWVEK